MNNELTQSAKETLKFFEEFIRRRPVVDFVREFREHLNIPPNGLIFTEEDKKEFSEPLNNFFYIPKRAVVLFSKEDKEKPFRVINTCIAFTKQQGVDSFHIQSMLRFFLFFNQSTDSSLRFIGSTADDLLELGHIPTTLSEYGKSEFLLNCLYRHFEQTGKTHPVVLYINPEVSQRQIQDFIAKNWLYIKAHQKNEKNKITGFRKKSTLERNDLIYKNRHLPRKEIMQVVIKKFGKILDYGHISKIISLEKKRRENK